MTDVPFSVSFTHRLRETSDVSAADFQTLARLLDPNSKVLLWCDSNLTIHDAWIQRLVRNLRSVPNVALCGDLHVIPGGETCKHDESVLRELLNLINHFDLDRRSYIIVAGGGAVLDVAGFAASMAHRGIRLIRIPSTTLAQADSGVGVKNAINYFGKKNWLGSFAVPFAVINDATVLQSLPDRDYCSGLTEAVKVSLLKDVSFFEFIRDHAEELRVRNPLIAPEVISRSCRLHLQHITEGGDAFETLEARPLDFGHWSAHRLEPMTHFRLRHGEAVGIGVALDTLYSVRKLGLSPHIASQVLQTFLDLGTPIWDDALGRKDEVLRGIEEFRQHLGGRLTVTMLQDVGMPIDVHQIDIEVMRSCIDQLQERQSESNLGMN